MKRLLLLLFFLPLLSGFNTSPEENACDSDNLANACIPKLASGFNFLKSYKVDGISNQKDKVEYSYVFTTGTQYMINVCAPGEGADGIVVNLYDQARNKIATNKVQGQLLSAIAFSCSATGVYYIQYTFDGSVSRCGGSALGFKR